MNIRSLPGKWDEFQSHLDNISHKDFNFSIIALQEIRSVPGNFDIDGYHPF